MSLHIRTVYFLSASGLLSLFALGCGTRPGVVHQISYDESLPEIAHSYGVDLLDILAANRIVDGSMLKAGQRIWIPRGSTKEFLKGESEVANATTEEADEISEADVPSENEKPSPKSVAKKPNPPKLVKGKRLTLKDLAWPAKGRVITPYGMRNNKMHNGVDVRVSPGALVGAAADGKVVYRGKGVAGYGDLVIVKHAGGLFTVYAYLGDITAPVGKWVNKGTPLATASNEPSKAFFHFEIRRGKKALNPERELPKLN